MKQKQEPTLGDNIFIYAVNDFAYRGIYIAQGDALFFFSIRRRHTRLVSDWSSDVCSSDLRRAVRAGQRRTVGAADPARRTRRPGDQTGGLAGEDQLAAGPVAAAEVRSRPG